MKVRRNGIELKTVWARHNLRATAVVFGLTVTMPLAAQFIERVDVTVANIDVVVTDRDGNPVRGLTRDDFQVYEDGKLQTITNFSAIEADRAESPAGAGESSSPPVAQPAPPRLIILFIDIDDIEPIRRRQFFEGLQEFFGTAFRDGDLVTLFTWSQRLREVVPPTASRADIEGVMHALARSDRWSEAVLLRLAGDHRVAAAERDARDGVGSAEDERLFQEWLIGERRCEMIQRKVSEVRNLITSISRTDMQKVLIFASDDLSLFPVRSCSTEMEIDALAAAANAYGFTIHAFHPPGQRERRVGYGPDGPGSTNGMPRIGAPSQGAIESAQTFDQAAGLLRLAERTGGLSGVGAGVSARLLQQAATQLDNYYSIGYRFSEGNEDLLRNVRVTTKNRTYRVRARKSVVRLSETARLRDELTANLYLPPHDQSQSPEFEATVERITRDGRFSLVHVQVSIATRDLVFLSSADEKRRGSFSVFVVGGRELGDASPVAELKREVVAVSGAEDSRTIYRFGVHVRPDTRRLSLAVRDNVSGEVATRLVMLPIQSRGSR